jgi:hypothetical protein
VRRMASGSGAPARSLCAVLATEAARDATGAGADCGLADGGTVGPILLSRCLVLGMDSVRRCRGIHDVFGPNRLAILTPDLWLSCWDRHARGLWPFRKRGRIPGRNLHPRDGRLLSQQRDGPRDNKPVVGWRLLRRRPVKACNSRWLPRWTPPSCPARLDGTARASSCSAAGGAR